MFRVWINIVDSDGTQLEVTIYRGNDRRHSRRVFRGLQNAISPVVNRITWEEVGK